MPDQFKHFYWLNLSLATMISLALYKSEKKKHPHFLWIFLFKPRDDVITIILILLLYNQHKFRSYVLLNLETSPLKKGPVTTS